MWCPQCRNEYREGITECADCHIQLVEFDELPEENPNSEGIDADFVNWAAERASELAGIREQQEAEEIDADEEYSSEDDFIEAIEEARSRKPFKSKEEIAADFKSSAYTLLIVGLAGLVIMILIITGVIPLNLAANVKYLSYGVMTAMFAIFVFVGIKSFADAKKYSELAVHENNLESEITEWFKSSFSAEEIDADAYHVGQINELADIEQFYKRSENIKEKIVANYPELEDAFLEKMVEDMYDALYES